MPSFLPYRNLLVGDGERDASDSDSEDSDLVIILAVENDLTPSCFFSAEDCMSHLLLFLASSDVASATCPRGGIGGVLILRDVRTLSSFLSDCTVLCGGFSSTSGSGGGCHLNLSSTFFSFFLSTATSSSDSELDPELLESSDPDLLDDENDLDLRGLESLSDFTGWAFIGTSFFSRSYCILLCCITSLGLLARSDLPSSGDLLLSTFVLSLVSRLSMVISLLSGLCLWLPFTVAAADRSLFLESLSGFSPGFQCVGGGLSDFFFTILGG